MQKENELPTIDHRYTCNLTWSGEKRGRLEAPGFQPVEVATPPEFNGHPGIWSPEHLFVAASLSCLMTTFLSLAEKARLRLASFRASATGRLTQGADSKLAITEILLTPEVVVFDAADEAKALELIEKAEKYCLISHSMTSTITLEPRIAVSPAAPAGAR
jgi:organic hydroperoxide reductase OsmC/OhrA